MSFPRYPKYKDSGVEWLGEVPAHWLIAKTARYFKIAMGQTILKEDLVDDGKWPVFSATDGDHYFGRVNKPLVRLGIGDIVIPARGNSIGAVKIVKEPSTTTQTTIYCKNLSSGRLAPEYVFHFLRGCRDNLFYFTQTAIPQITVEEVGANPILLPPPAEQTLIASFLDRETAKIDGLVAEQRRLIELLKEKRQAVMSHAVTKGLNPHAPMKPSGIEWLGDVPEHWKVQRVKFVAKLESGHTPSKQVPEYWENCEIPWVSLNDSKQLAVVDYITDTAIQINEQGLANSSAHILPAGAVVFTRDATIGLAAITARPMAVSQHLIAWCPSERIQALFLLRVFNVMKTYLDTVTFGATIKTIGMPDVKKLVTPVPPLEEQREITDFIISTTSKVDALVTEAESAVKLLQERRTALISAAVTGKIDVRGLVESEAA
jgi:type I restriction enzyme, S subunit